MSHFSYVARSRIRTPPVNSNKISNWFALANTRASLRRRRIRARQRWRRGRSRGPYLQELFQAVSLLALFGNLAFAVDRLACHSLGLIQRPRRSFKHLQVYSVGALV